MSLNVMVASISGEHFGSQLCSIRHLICAGYKPSLCFVGSGGSVAVCCMCAADSSPNKLDEVASGINSSLFIKEKQEVSILPPSLRNVFSGSTYEHSNEAVGFFTKYFNVHNFTDTEVWICAINNQTGKVGLFCNLTQTQAKIKGHHYDTASFNSEPLKYMDCNPVNIARSCQASSSIPIMIEPILIGKQYYVDCGVKYASSLTPLKAELEKILHNYNQLHIMYLSGYDVEKELQVIPVRSNMLQELAGTFDHAVKGHLQQDRAVAHDLLKRYGNKIRYAQGGVDCLSDILNRISSINCKWASVIELYPSCTELIKLSNFTGDDVVKCMNNTIIKLRIRWVGPKRAFNNISGLCIIRYI